MSRLHLTERALADIDEIDRDSADRWGQRVADEYVADLGAALDRLEANQSQTLLLWVGIYPTITCVLWLMLPMLQQRFPLPVVTLIITAVVVPLMNYVVMPFLLGRFGGWVRR